MIITVASLIFLFILGASLGSFSSAISYRIKFEKLIINDRSICPQCRNQLGFLDLIPIFSYIFLLGKCRHCSARIGIKYLFIELLSGFYFLFVGLLFINGDISSMALGTYLVFGLVSNILIVSDFEYFELPDEMNLVLFLLSLFSIYTLGSNIGIHIVSGIAAGVFFFIVFRLSGGKKMGFGDVKLAVGLGIFFNFIVFIYLVLFASISGIIYGVVRSRIEAKELSKYRVPYGGVILIVCLIWIIFINTEIGQTLKDYFW